MSLHKVENISWEFRSQNPQNILSKNFCRHKDEVDGGKHFVGPGAMGTQKDGVCVAQQADSDVARPTLKYGSSALHIIPVVTL